MSFERNIPKILFYRFFREFWLIIPIIVPFYHSFGLSNTQILIIQSIFSIVLLLGEVPSGYFADLYGRKTALVLGASLLPIGLGIYAFSSSFWFFIIAEIFLGIGFSLCSGSDSALLFDSLKKCHRKGEYHRLEGRTESSGRLGSTLASVAGGLLALLSLRIPFYINVLTSLVLILLALSMLEVPRRKPRQSSHWKTVLSVVSNCMKNREILSIMLQMAVVLATGIIGLWGYLMALDQFKVPLFAFGISFAMFQLTSAAASFLSHHIHGTLGNRWVNLLLLIIPLDFLLLALLPHPMMLFLGLLNAFVWGFSTPLFLSRLNKKIGSDHRATVLSFASLLGRSGFVLFSPLFGLLWDRISLSAAFIFLAIIFLSVFIPSWGLGKKS